MAPDLTLCLPAELLLRIFDFYQHGDTPRRFICGPGRVCSRWRRLALAHRSFSKDIWLQRDMSLPGMGMFCAQLEAGGDGDIELSMMQPDDIFPVLPYIKEHLHRCVSLYIDYCGSPGELLALFSALCESSAPRLKVLYLHVEPIQDPDDIEQDWQESLLMFPSSIFRGEAPLLRRIRLCGAVCMLFDQGPIAAFRGVESLEVHVYDCGPPAVAAALVAAPNTRRLEIVGVMRDTGPWPTIHLPPSLQLKAIMFSALDSAWDAAIGMLTVYDLPEFAVFSGVPTHYIHNYLKRLQGPLELSIIDSQHLGLDHTDAVLSSPESGRAVMLVDAIRTLPFTPYTGRIVRLELVSSEWLTSHLGVCLPQLHTLIIHVMADRLRPGCPTQCRVHCPKLRALTLQRGRRAPVDAFRVKADHVAYFLRDRLRLEADAGCVSVRVSRPLVLTGRRSWLLATVRSITEV